MYVNEKYVYKYMLDRHIMWFMWFSMIYVNRKKCRKIPTETDANAWEILFAHTCDMPHMLTWMGSLPEFCVQFFLSS